MIIHIQFINDLIRERQDSKIKTLTIVVFSLSHQNQNVLHR